MQLVIGTLMLAISFNAEEYMNNVSSAVVPEECNLILSSALRTYLCTICRVYDACHIISYFEAATYPDEVVQVDGLVAMCVYLSSVSQEQQKRS